MINLQDPEGRSAAAGEYVLGTLSQVDHDAFEQALKQRIDLQAEVYAWQDRLLVLTRQTQPFAPREQLWRRIDVSLDAVARVFSGLREKRKPLRLALWQHLRLWQGLSGLAVAACLVLSILLVQQEQSQQVGPRYLALLQSPQDQSTGWVVEIQAGNKLRLKPVISGQPVPRGRALQFWTKPQGAAGPTSLGLLVSGGVLELPVSRLPSVGAQQLFEITLEPENGSPIGRPTGPILYVGRTVAL